MSIKHLTGRTTEEILGKLTGAEGAQYLCEMGIKKNMIELVTTALDKGLNLLNNSWEGELWRAFNHVREDIVIIMLKHESGERMLKTNKVNGEKYKSNAHGNDQHYDFKNSVLNHAIETSSGMPRLVKYLLSTGLYSKKDIRYIMRISQKRKWQHNNIECFEILEKHLKRDVNEAYDFHKTFLQIFKNNNESDYYNYIVLKGDDLFNVRLMSGEQWTYKYIRKIDKNTYTINGTLISNPPIKLIVLFQKKLKKLQTNVNTQ